MMTHGNKIIVHQLPEPYPPAGHWIAESPAVLAKWRSHLTIGHLHDTQTNHCPIHLLDRTRLQRDIGPRDDGFICNEKGEFCSVVICKNTNIPCQAN